MGLDGFLEEHAWADVRREKFLDDNSIGRNGWRIDSASERWIRYLVNRKEPH